MGKSVIAGAGVYMTSPRGKEFRAVAELIDILEDVRLLTWDLCGRALTLAQYAEKLYTPERLEELAAVHRPHVAVDDDDDEAAKPTETEQGAEEVVHVEASEEDEDEEESIEDAIKRELAELKQTTGGKRKRGKEDEGADGQSIKRVKRRFEKRDTDTQCCKWRDIRLHSATAADFLCPSVLRACSAAVRPCGARRDYRQRPRRRRAQPLEVSNRF